MLRRIDSQNKNPSQDKKEHKELLSSKNVVKSDIEILGVTKKNKEVEIEQKESELADVVSDIDIKKEEVKVASSEKEKEAKKLSVLKEEVVPLEVKTEKLKSEISENEKTNKLILDDIAIGQGNLVSMNARTEEDGDKSILLKEENHVLASDNINVKKETDILTSSVVSLKKEEIDLQDNITELENKQESAENEYLFAIEKRDKEELECVQKKSEMQTEITALETTKKEAGDRVQKLNEFYDSIKVQIQEKVDILLSVKDSLNLNLKKEQISKVNESVTAFLKGLGI